MRCIQCIVPSRLLCSILSISGNLISGDHELSCEHSPKSMSRSCMCTFLLPFTAGDSQALHRRLGLTSHTMNLHIRVEHSHFLCLTHHYSLQPSSILPPSFLSQPDPPNTTDAFSNYHLSTSTHASTWARNSSYTSMAAAVTSRLSPSWTRFSSTVSSALCHAASSVIADRVADRDLQVTSKPTSGRSSIDVYQHDLYTPAQKELYKTYP